MHALLYSVRSAERLPADYTQHGAHRFRLEATLAHAAGTLLALGVAKQGHRMGSTVLPNFQRGPAHNARQRVLFVERKW